MRDPQVRETAFRGRGFRFACWDVWGPGVGAEVAGHPHPSWFSFEDEAEVRERNWTVGEGDVVLDVGAQYGPYSLTALASGAGQVFAWSPQWHFGPEPDADTLRRSLELNGWSGRAKVYREGLWEQDGWLDEEKRRFYGTENPGGKFVIEVGTLDSWASREGVEKVDWMKLDVEGAEIEVLRGAAGMVSRLRPKIQVELHVSMRPGVDEEVDVLLRTLGYGVKSSVRHVGVTHALYLPE